MSNIFPFPRKCDVCGDLIYLVTTPTNGVVPVDRRARPNLVGVAVEFEPATGEMRGSLKRSAADTHALHTCRKNSLEKHS